MDAIAQATERWVDLVGDLLSAPAAPFPRHRIADELVATFDAQVGWSALDHDGHMACEMAVPARFPTVELVRSWFPHGMVDHPVWSWHMTTQNPQPMTVGRVPWELVPRRSLETLTDCLGPCDLDQQMTITYRLNARTQRAFVLAQGERDFTDGQLELARRIQPLISLVARRLVACEPVASSQAAVTGLTCRESAVLALLAEGLTANAIGHRLHISPRTVHVHLRSLYRKLAVSDRLRAVLTAQEAGLLPPRPSAVEPPNEIPAGSALPPPTPAPELGGATSRTLKPVRAQKGVWVWPGRGLQAYPVAGLRSSPTGAEDPAAEPGPPAPTDLAELQ